MPNNGRLEISHDGEIVRRNSSAICNDIDVMLKNLFEQYGWTVENMAKVGSRYEVNIKSSNNDEKEIVVYVGKIRNELRSANEKKIQLGQVDPRNDDKHRTIILGIYVFDENDSVDDAIFVGYHINDDMNYTGNPSIRGTMVDKILINAKTKGFVYDKENNTVGFTSAFIYYYLDNFYKLHYESQDVINAIVQSDSANDERAQENFLRNETLNGPRNVIYFGAPGTGKSHKVKEIVGHIVGDSQMERVTFYPDYTYAQFVGSYKPVSVVENNVRKIDYKFVEGPFVRVLCKALSDKDNPYFLIIEEINRAKPAAVFGDVFQLLDRGDDGKSEYEIHPSNEMKERIAELTGQDIAAVESIQIPANMYIWATMNSADQGVFPIDAAFKRRWSFEYVGVDDGKNDISSNSNIVVSVDKEPYKEGTDTDGRIIGWNDLRSEINKILSNSLKVHEDKLLGPFFLKSHEMNADSFKNKVLMYLFEDAAKMKRPDLFTVGEGINRFSKICDKFDHEGLAVFVDKDGGFKKLWDAAPRVSEGNDNQETEQPPVEGTEE